MSGEPPIVLRVSLFTVEYWDVIQTSVLDAPVSEKLSQAGYSLGGKQSNSDSLPFPYSWACWRLAIRADFSSWNGN